MQYELDLVPAVRRPYRHPAAFRRPAGKGLRTPSLPVVRRLPARTPLLEVRPLLPEIGSLAGGGRWVTWLAPPVVPTRVACLRHRIPQGCHRLVFPVAGAADWQRWLERALASGTSALVLAWPKPGARLDIELLSRRAREGCCSLYLFEQTAGAPGFA